MDEQSYLTYLMQAERTLYHVAATLLRDEHDRQDAMQETALRAWQHRGKLREERYFTTWAVRIMINVCRTMQRRSRRMTPTACVPEQPAFPEGDVELRVLLDELPERLRLPLVLYYLEGLSVDEIARATGAPSGTIKYRLHQARKALRIELDDGKEG